MLRGGRLIKFEIASYLQGRDIARPSRMAADSFFTLLISMSVRGHFGTIRCSHLVFAPFASVFAPCSCCQLEPGHYP